MVRTTIMFPENLKKKVETASKKMHISLGEFLRIAARDFLEREKRKWIDDPLVSGDYVIEHSAPSSVSENIDRYLYGKHE
jgi:hypothetical protein